MSCIPLSTYIPNYMIVSRVFTHVFVHTGGLPNAVLIASTSIPCVFLKGIDTVTFAGKGEGLTITPFAAGHMIGGSIWRISTAVGEDVVYAVDYNHRKELHLNSTALDCFPKAC